MISQTVLKIEEYVTQKPLLTYKIDDYFLAKLYNLLLKYCLTHESIEHLMVAFGLLHQFVIAHDKTTAATTHEDLSASILDGDYFYSLYYEYSAKHAFYLIEHDFASVLKDCEVAHLNGQAPTLLECIKLFLEKRASENGIFS